MARIAPDGTFGVPKLGPLIAAGKTAHQFQAEIIARLSPSWQVSVVPCMCDFYYHIAGEVNSPGLKAHLPGLTISRAIAAAGGLARPDIRQRVTITRADGQKISIILHPTQPNDVEIRPDDFIHVSRRVF